MDKPREITIEKEDPDAFTTNEYVVQYKDDQIPLFYGNIYECGIFVQGYYWTYNQEQQL